MKYPGYLLRVGMLLLPVVAAMAMPMAAHRFDASASELTLGKVEPLLARKKVPCDLEVTQRASLYSATIGTTVEFYILVRNIGAGAAAGVVIRDTIPAETSFQYASTTRGTFTDSSGVLVCLPGNMAPGDSAVITLGLLTLTPGFVRNGATGVTSTLDSNPGNNFYSLVIYVAPPQSADLGVTQSHSPDSVAVGNYLYYTIQVNNQGPTEAVDVGLTQQLSGVPATAVSAYTNHGTCSVDSTGQVSCAFGTVTVGDSVLAQVYVVPAANGLLYSNVAVSSPTPDPNSSNNSSSDVTTVAEPHVADLNLTFRRTPDSPSAGNNITYGFDVTNRGPFDAADVTMGYQTYNLPATVVSVSTSRGTCRPDTSGLVLCSFGTLASGDSVHTGDSVHVEVVVVPATEGYLYSYAYVSSPTPDPNPYDNTVYDYVLVVPSAKLLINDLIALVKSYRLRPGAEQNLVSALQDAQTVLAAADTAGACTALGTFRQRVARLAGRGLTVDQAYQLDSRAAGIQALLHCGGAAAAAARAAAPDPVVTEFSFKLITPPGEATQRLRLALPVGGHVRLDVFDIGGRLVRTAWNGQMAAGSHEVGWDGRNGGGQRAPAGMYFMRVMAGTNRAVARVLLLR